MDACASVSHGAVVDAATGEMFQCEASSLWDSRVAKLVGLECGQAKLQRRDFEKASEVFGRGLYYGRQEYWRLWDQACG
jgi:hypothetical protein